MVASVGATVPMSVTAATSEMMDRRDPETEERGADRHAHRNHRAERDEQDDHREEEPDDVRVAALVAAEVVDDRTAELDAKSGLFGRCSSRLELLHGLGRQAGGALVVLHAYVADRAVLRHERGSDVGRGRAEDLRHVRALAGSEVRLRLRDRGLDRRITQRPALRLEHDAGRPARLGGEPLLEQVLCLLRLRAGNRVHVGRLAADGLRPSADDDREQDPDPDRDPLAPRRGPAEPIEETCHACPCPCSWSRRWTRYACARVSTRILRHAGACGEARVPPASRAGATFRAHTAECASGT